jgi:hypothetical protein
LEGKVKAEGESIVLREEVNARKGKDVGADGKGKGFFVVGEFGKGKSEVPVFGRPGIHDLDERVVFRGVVGSAGDDEQGFLARMPRDVKTGGLLEIPEFEDGKTVPLFLIGP